MTQFGVASLIKSTRILLPSSSSSLDELSLSPWLAQQQQQLLLLRGGGSVAQEAMKLASIPALAMLIFTLVGLKIKVPTKLVGALQHFAGGILLSTIALELLPEMVKAEGLSQNLASGVGFFTGVALFLLLNKFLPEEEELSSNHKNENKAFPTTFITALSIDAALDGLLIGIAMAAGPSASTMLSASLSVEMAFLGLTLATALYGRRRSTSLPSAAIGPLSLLLGSFLGGSLASTLSNSPTLLSGLFGFGTSALLFMVAEELLLEAHEEGEHVWWIDVQLYTGFFACLLASKLLE
mmetsp:Transcript_12615/g.18545  ORF Transcript_12615/g.18545 Transcript_12615/m.18545 type:complete len:296 (+) Transcript_12615:75-962(+)